MRRLLYCLWTAVVILGFIGCRSEKVSEFEIERSQCRLNFRSAGGAIKQFVSESGGVYPKQVAEAYENLGITNEVVLLKVLKCPGFHSIESTNESILRRAGVEYVDWSKWFGKSNPAPDTFPVIYDAHMSNHEGRGINVLLMDGRVIWDANGTWLRAFVREHSQYGLEVPR